MKKIVSVFAVLLGLGIIVGCSPSPTVERATDNVAVSKDVLAEHNIPMSPDLIFHEKEENPKGGNLNKIPMFQVKKDFQWSEAGMSFVESLQASDYTIFQFLFKKREKTLSNPNAATAEGARSDVVDFYLENLLKNGWALVLLPDYSRTLFRGGFYIRGDTMPLLFQNIKTPSQLLLLDHKKYPRTASIGENKGVPVYWLILYTNPKITKPLPALTKLHGEKYIDTKHPEAYLELLENKIFIVQYFNYTQDVMISAGKYTIESGTITLDSPDNFPIKGSKIGDKIIFKELTGLNGEFVKK